MKKLFIIVITLLIASIKLTAATRTSSSKSSRRVASQKKLPTPNEMQCRENIDYCFNYYCFDKKTLSNGVYSKCGRESASTITINVDDCLDTRGIIKNLDLKDGCRAYTYNYIVALLGNKDTIETALKKQTKECSEATVALDAAKACWAKMIAHDGSIDSSLRTQLVALCGYAKSKDTDMVDRFYHAGDYGDSNIAAQMDMELTGQNTQKRENWRQVVDGVLAGYMEMAELACGEEDYNITKVNDYLPDSRTNLAMVKAQAQADEMGRSTANRIVNSWFRKTDCLNSPLPKGGLRWEYIEDGAPDCRIICLDGYTEGNNSSECIEKKETIIVFNGPSNTEMAYVGEPSTTPTQEPTYIPQKTNDNYNPFTEKEPDNTDYNDYPQSKVCSKSTLKKRTYGSVPPTKREICKVFFPDCANGKLGRMRWYWRNTDKPSDEFFCLGDDYNKTHIFDFWINLTLTDINNAFTTKFIKFGDNYASNASKYIKEQCPNICGNGTTKSNPKPVNNANTQTNSSTCDLDIESSVDYEIQKQWDNYLANYNGNCQTEKNNLLTTLNAYRNPAGVGNNRYGPSASDVVRIMNNMKECVCDGKTSTTNTYSSSSKTYNKATNCDAINNLYDYIYTDIKYAQEWDSVLKQYNGSCSTKKLQNYVSRILKNDYIDVEDRNAILMEVEKFKLCACKGKTSTTNTSSNNTIILPSYNQKYCEIVKNLPRMYMDMNEGKNNAKQWRDFLNEYNGNCNKTELKKYNDKILSNAVAVTQSEIERIVMEEAKFKSCVCSKKN